MTRISTDYLINPHVNIVFLHMLSAYQWQPLQFKSKQYKPLELCKNFPTSWYYSLTLNANKMWTYCPSSKHPLLAKHWARLGAIRNLIVNLYGHVWDVDCVEVIGNSLLYRSQQLAYFQHYKLARLFYWRGTRWEIITVCCHVMKIFLLWRKVRIM